MSLPVDVENDPKRLTSTWQKKGGRSPSGVPRDRLRVGDMDVSASFRRVLPVALCAGALLAGCSEQRGSGPRALPESCSRTGPLRTPGNTPCGFARPCLEPASPGNPRGDAADTGEYFDRGSPPGGDRGKDDPDVCSNIWPGALHDYTQAGGLVRLDAFPDFDSVMSLRTPRELLERFRVADGHFYEVPWKTNPLMMFYNRRLFREAGVEGVPSTYGGYLAAGEKVVTHRYEGGQRTCGWGQGCPAYLVAAAFRFLSFLHCGVRRPDAPHRRTAIIRRQFRRRRLCLLP